LGSPWIFGVRVRGPPSILTCFDLQSGEKGEDEKEDWQLSRTW
jgi:hypothetical protein